MAKAPRVTVDKDLLRALVHAIFAASGVSDGDAGVIADALVWANLRGTDSHGVSRIPRYLELFASGEAKAAPTMRLERPRPAALLLDADGAAGPVALSRAMHEAVAAARVTGVAWATVRGTVHTGAIGYYTRIAAEAGMAGIGIVAGIPNMAYHGGRGAGLATSPISIAIPAHRHPTVLLDMATATMALGRIQQYRLQGKTLPDGAALTEEGEPTTDPATAAIPLPLGGAKGAGLALAFEMLTSLLVANPIVTEFHAGTPLGRRHRQNASLMTIDISAFTDLATFRNSVDATLETVKALPRASGVAEILFPGERGARTFAARLRSGVPLPGATWQSLTKSAERLGVAVPAASEAAG